MKHDCDECGKRVPALYGINEKQNVCADCLWAKYSALQMAHSQLKAAIDDARKGERERCAKIIKDFPTDDYNDEQEVDDALSRVMIKILEGTTP